MQGLQGLLLIVGGLQMGFEFPTAPPAPHPLTTGAPPYHPTPPPPHAPQKYAKAEDIRLGVQVPTICHLRADIERSAVVHVVDVGMASWEWP